MNDHSRSWVVWYLLKNFCLYVPSASNWTSLHTGEGTGFRHSIHLEGFVTICWILMRLEINQNIDVIQRFGRKWNNNWHRFYSGDGTRNNYTTMRVIQKQCWETNMTLNSEQKSGTSDVTVIKNNAFIYFVLI